MLAYGLEADRPITSDKSDYTPLAARTLPQKPRRWQPKLLPPPYPPRVPCLRLLVLRLAMRIRRAGLGRNAWPDCWMNFRELGWANAGWTGGRGPLAWTCKCRCFWDNFAWPGTGAGPSRFIASRHGDGSLMPWRRNPRHHASYCMGLQDPSKRRGNCCRWARSSRFAESSCKPAAQRCWTCSGNCRRSASCWKPMPLICCRLPPG